MRLPEKPARGWGDPGLETRQRCKVPPRVAVPPFLGLLRMQGLADATSRTQVETSIAC